MNGNYRTQEEPSAAIKAQANDVIKCLGNGGKGKSVVEEAFAEFYLKAQQHTITAGDFGIVVRLLYQHAVGSRTADKAHKDYELTRQKCRQVILSANATYSGLDQPTAFALHNSVVDRVEKDDSLDGLLRTYSAFRDARDKHNGRPQAAHGVHRAKTNRSWVSAPSGD